MGQHVDSGDLEKLENDYPGWHVWRGVGDTGWYVRRELSSPPVVFRAETVEKLREQVKEHVAARERP